MPTFTYKALRKEDNEAYEGKVEAKDRFEIYSIVRKEGGQVVSVAEVKRGASGLSASMQIDVGKYLFRVKQRDVILFTRNLGAMLTAGLSVSRALGVIERQSKKVKLKDMVKQVRTDIEKGGSLSDALKKHPKIFSKLVTSMVAAGEESGSLAESLSTISNQLEEALELKKKVKGAMIYPAVIVFVLGLVGALMMIFIVPTLTETFKDMDMELPMSTEVVITISDLLVANTLSAFLVVVASIVTFIYAMRTKIGSRIFETVFLHIPIIGTLVKEVNSARTGRTLSSLLSSGVNMLGAIEITRDVIQNSYYKDVLTQAHDTVQKGKPLGQVFMDAEKLYPPLVGELIAVGEETGALPDMLTEVAQYYEREVGQKTKNMSTIIEPFLMLIVGGAVGFFAVSMIAPIYGMTSTI